MSARKPAASVFLDSSAFIPLIDETHAQHTRVTRYIEATTALPAIDAIVLSEVSAGIGDGVDKDALVELYTRQFRVPSFDVRAAKVCSELFRILKSAGQIHRKGEERQVTKADLLILSNAIVNGASAFLYEDKHFAHYSAFLPETVCGYRLPPFVRLSSLPDVVTQLEMQGF